ncbi:MAG: molybdopterin biosynthesis protein [Collinsella sp.]|nr:molybdopterin biosynthesis protein [Collinsella sp.]
MTESMKAPSIDAWLREAKEDPGFRACGMYLIHNGVVRETPKAQVRDVVTSGVRPGGKVAGMIFGSDPEKVALAIERTRAMPGVGYVRVWLNEGELAVGDDIMLVLIGGDIRPHVVDALQFLVGTLKDECVTEVELGA